MAEVSGDVSLRDWAGRMGNELKPLKTWLLLAGVADILGILRKTNVKMQRGHLGLLMAQELKDACLMELNAYFSNGGPCQEA
eukprot:3974183-Karenia_brevis.AAC.1